MTSTLRTVAIVGLVAIGGTLLAMGLSAATPSASGSGGIERVPVEQVETDPMDFHHGIGGHPHRVGDRPAFDPAGYGDAPCDRGDGRGHDDGVTPEGEGGSQENPPTTPEAPSTTPESPSTTPQAF